MISTCIIAYLGAWLATAIATYVAARLLADRDRPAENPLLVSLAAGAVWPLLILGAVELSSVAVVSTARSMRAPATIPESWLREPLNAAGPLR